MENLQKSPEITNPIQIPKRIIWTAQGLQMLSTHLATIFVARIFMTPLKFKTPEREQMMRKSAKKKMVKVNENGKSIAVYTYGYSKKKVLLVHGWSGRGTQLFQLSDKILENKMMVVSFDAPAHGISSGKTSNLLEYIQCIKQINEEYGPFEAAIGHSFGGMSLLNAISRGLPLNKLVIIGADNSIEEILKTFAIKLKLKPKIAHELEAYFNQKLGLNLRDHASSIAAKNVKTPTLVLHDSGDKFVPVSSALSIRQNLEHGELVMTQDLGHHKIFKDKQVIQRIIDFIQ